MLSSLERSRFTRRTATVTTSAPDASMARTMASLDWYLPVPTMRREWRVRSPMTSGVSVNAGAAAMFVMLSSGGSTAADKMNQLDAVAFADGRCGEALATHDSPVVLHHDG